MNAKINSQLARKPNIKLRNENRSYGRHTYRVLNFNVVPADRTWVTRDFLSPLNEGKNTVVVHTTTSVMSIYLCEKYDWRSLTWGVLMICTVMLLMWKYNWRSLTWLLSSGCMGVPHACSQRTCTMHTFRLPCEACLIPRLSTIRGGKPGYVANISMCVKIHTARM